MKTYLLIILLLFSSCDFGVHTVDGDIYYRFESKQAKRLNIEQTSYYKIDTSKAYQWKMNELTPQDKEKGF